MIFIIFKRLQFSTKQGNFARNEKNGKRYKQLKHFDPNITSQKLEIKTLGITICHRLLEGF